MTDVVNVPKYLLEHQNDISAETRVIKAVVDYLLQYKVAPKHYSIGLEMADEWIMIQIDEQCGYVDRQVSKSNFEFINGTCFSITFDELSKGLQSFGLLPLPTQ